MSALLPEDILLLRALLEDGGFTARYVALRAGLPVGRLATRRATASLKHMRRLGLVGHLDAAKPIAWLRTPAGSAELCQREDRP